MTNFESVFHNVALNDYAYENIRPLLKPGVTELEVSDMLSKLYAEKNGKPIRFEGDIISGERTALIGDVASDRALKQGDILILDMQPFSRGFSADTTRAFFIGEPTDEQRTVYAQLEKALALGESLLRPNARACDVHSAVRSFLDAFGNGFSFPHHAGHALSVLPFEQPQLIDTVCDPLEEGMIIALEPGLYNEEYGIRIENNYLITQDGCQKLGTLTTDINYFTI